MEWKRRGLIVSLSVMALVTLVSGPALGAVDPDKIVFNDSGEPLSDTLVLGLKDNNMTIVAYNVYDDVGDPIGTITSWSKTGNDVVNITAMNTGQTFRVKALKTGTATLTVKSQGDTKNLTATLTIVVKDSTAMTSPSKGFIPGFEAQLVAMALGISALAIFRKLRL